MTEAGIEDGALVLVRQQPTADSGQNVVALIDDEATIKELQLSRMRRFFGLEPRIRHINRLFLRETSRFRAWWSLHFPS